MNKLLINITTLNQQATERNIVHGQLCCVCFCVIFLNGFVSLSNILKLLDKHSTRLVMCCLLLCHIFECCGIFVKEFKTFLIDKTLAFHHFWKSFLKMQFRCIHDKSFGCYVNMFSITFDPCFCKIKNVLWLYFINYLQSYIFLLSILK